MNSQFNNERQLNIALIDLHLFLYIYKLPKRTYALLENQINEKTKFRISSRSQLNHKTMLLGVGRIMFGENAQRVHSWGDIN